MRFFPDNECSCALDGQRVESSYFAVGNVDEVGFFGHEVDVSPGDQIVVFKIQSSGLNGNNPGATNGKLVATLAGGG